jgi:hypothetical protein
MHLAEPVAGCVLGYPGGRLPGRRLRQDPGLHPPALIRMLVDITVITREIAPAVYLQNVL